MNLFVISYQFHAAGLLKVTCTGHHIAKRHHKP
jgi:hypothetical protein